MRPRWKRLLCPCFWIFGRRGADRAENWPKVIAAVKPLKELAEELAGKVKVGKVNVDEEPELSSDFGIVSIPTLVVVKDGKVVQTATGVRPKNAILAMLG